MYVNFEFAAQLPSPYSRVKKCAKFKTNLHLVSVDSFLFYLSSSSSSLLVFETVSWCNSRLCSKANFLPFADGPEYFYSDRGKLRLKFEGYTYQKSNVGQSGRVYWRCEEARKIEMKCPAKLIASADGASFRRNKDHNHGPVIESSILTLDDIVEGIKKWGWIWFSHLFCVLCRFWNFHKSPWICSLKRPKWVLVPPKRSKSQFEELLVLLSPPKQES